MGGAGTREVAAEKRLVALRHCRWGTAGGPGGCRPHSCRQVVLALGPTLAVHTAATWWFGDSLAGMTPLGAWCLSIRHRPGRGSPC